MLTVFFSLLARLRRKVLPANDNDDERAVIRKFGAHLERVLRKGHSHACNKPPSVKTVW